MTYFRRGKHSVPGTLDKSRDRLAQTGGMVRGGLARHSRQALAVTALAGVSAFGLISGAANASDNDPAPVDAAKAITSVSSFDALAERQAVADDASRAQRSTPVETTTTKPATTKPVTTPPKKPVAAPKPAKAAPKPPAAAPRPAWLIPMKGAQVTSCFGQRWGVLHAGIDFAMPNGTPIRAVGAGTVVSAGWAYSGYGISVVVDHHNGYLTHYAHMSQDKVSVGDEVKAGDILGLEGSTGDSTGPHLHFEVHKGMWNQINPAGWLADRGIQTSC
ncbi:M23 family metallopeptidase [Catellatospora methionotrophica]|uniref:M23 family metallopeptidase n=1 Tax=Catellatospora methionotrophica TaxID=121620 RepID=UPI001EF2FAFD|nr:M23 family metallopeptidase [Catellatospora methionotrophica]